MSEGCSNKDIANKVGFCAVTIGALRIRFDQMRLEELSDRPRRGQPRKVNDERIEESIEKTLRSKPQEATHWSTLNLSCLWPLRPGKPEGHTPEYYRQAPPHCLPHSM